MRAKALYLAQELADEPGGEPRRADEEIAALLRWLADGRFTFLGYREYDLEPGSGTTLVRAVPGTGLGILRHDHARSRLVRGAAARGRRPGPGPRQRLIVTKANSRSTVHRPSYLDYVAVKRVDARRARSSASTGSWACTPTWPSPRASPASRSPGAS